LDIATVQLLPEAGLTVLGENRVQDLVAKAAAMPVQVEWHMIGHLQRNKAKMACELASLIHSVDSVRRAEAISDCGVQLCKRVPVLIEVNVSGENSKQGLAPEELESCLEAMLEMGGIEPRGLMTMAPLGADPEATRPVFASLRELMHRTRARMALPCLTELSMGMSGDFEQAIEEGATLVRVGSALYEGLL
jgi:pyridoxal phosphate enzyme (YggS family)